MESPVTNSTKTKGTTDEKPKDLAQRIDELNLSHSDEELSDIECDLCNKSFNTVAKYNEHLLSKKHHQAIIKAKLRQKLKKDGFLSDDPKKEVEKEVEDSLPSFASTEELYCDVCNRAISGYKSFAAHMEGRTHVRNLRKQKMMEGMKGMKDFLQDDSFDVQSDEVGILQKSFTRCTLCEKTFSGPECYRQHKIGVSHNKKLLHMKLIDGIRKDVNLENGMEDGKAKCSVCNKSFSGPKPYLMHIKSPAHEKELKRLEFEKELSEFFTKDPTGKHFVCNECKKDFPDIFSCKSHLDNNSHGKQNVKDELFGFVASNPEIVAVKSVQNVSSDEDSEEKGHFQNGHYFLMCKLCHTSFSGPQSAQDHLKSKNHLKAKREKAERKLFKEKMKEKQNGCPPTDQKDNDGSEGKSAMASSNGNKSGSASHADDFEFL